MTNTNTEKVAEELLLFIPLFVGIGGLSDISLSPRLFAHYVWPMDAQTPKALKSAVIAALVATGLALSALVFVGWMRFGADIVLTYAENGLSSCL
ncbi:MAG: hypothetical protein ACK4PN_18210 [Allorhizobium sp.]